MKKKRFMMYIVIALVIFIGFEVVRVRRMISIGESIVENTTSYTRDLDSSKQFLFIGDSTMVGVGAEDPEDSVAGRFGGDHPNVKIVNEGVSGRKMAAIADAVEQQNGERYDLVVLVAGGNDIVRRTPLDEYEVDLRRALDSASALGDTVLYTHGGTLGTALLLPVGTRWAFDLRTQAMRRRAIKIVNEYENVHYVDIYKEPKDDLFGKDPDRYYSKDIFHPSGEGYRLWYEDMTAKLQEINWEI